MFGKNTLGTTEWYCNSNEKKATLFETSGEPINTLAIICRNDDYANSFPKLRLCMFKETGELIAITEELRLYRTIDDLILAPRILKIIDSQGNPITINPAPGKYRLGVHVGWNNEESGSFGGAIRISMTRNEAVKSYENSDNYEDGTSDSFGAATEEVKEFSIYAYSTEEQPPIPTVSLIINVAMGGITDPQGIITFALESPATIQEVEAIADSNYRFDHWILDGENETENPITITMDANHTLTPVFVSTQDPNAPVSITVDFEKDTDFLVGEGTLWEVSEGILQYPQNLIYAPVTSPVRSGSRAAKLELTNPDTNEHRRLELLHRWHPTKTKELWLEFYIFIPTNFPLTERTTIFRSIYERAFRPYTPADYVFQTHLSIWGNDGRSSRPTYGHPIFLITRKQNFDLPNPATAEENAASDAQQEFVDGQWQWKSDVPIQDRLLPENLLGKWIGIRSYVFRDVDAWRTGNKNSGIFKMWMAIPPNYVWQLVIEDLNTRTIGIDPDILAAIIDNWGYGYFASGMSNYTDYPSAPKTLYFDDLIMSGVQIFPEETPVYHDLLIYTNLMAAVSYTVDSQTQNTGAAISLKEAGYTITMPQTVQTELRTYTFKKWSDDTTGNPKTISLTENLILTAVYEETGVPPPTGGCLLFEATKGTVFMGYLPQIRRFRDRCLSKELQRFYYGLSRYIAPKIKQLRRKK